MQALGHLEQAGRPFCSSGGQGLPELEVQMHRPCSRPSGIAHSGVHRRQQAAQRHDVVWGGYVHGPAGVAPKDLDLIKPQLQTLEVLQGLTASIRRLMGALVSTDQSERQAQPQAMQEPAVECTVCR